MCTWIRVRVCACDRMHTHVYLCIYACVLLCVHMGVCDREQARPWWFSGITTYTYLPL